MLRQKPLSSLNLKSTFLVWGFPSQGPRSRALARELGIDSLHFIYKSTRRGATSALFRYAYQTFQTLNILFRERPRLVFVQSPPSLAVLFVYLYCALGRARYVVDAHSSAFTLRIWNRPAWLHRFLARRAVTTLVTNEHFQQTIRDRGGHAFVLRDVPTRFDVRESYPLDGVFSLAMVNTFSEDEPLAEVLEAARALPEVRFYVTGKKKSAPPGVVENAPANVRFTDFLPDDAYYALLKDAQAVLCLTTRNHTMQRGACEALSLGTPIITSDWPLLRDYFRTGAVHVANTREDIRRGVLELRARYLDYQAGIRDLQVAQQREWQEKSGALIDLIDHATLDGSRGR